MYRILITPQMRKDAKRYLGCLPKSGIIQCLERMKNNLKPVKKLNNLKDYENYLTELITWYPLIQILPPNLFNRFICKHPNIQKLSASDLKEKFCSTGESEKSFSDMIISRMRYDEAKKLIVSYLKSYDILTCVYCNQSRIHYDSLNSEKMSGTLDHFYNKDRYPFLCTSFFNLFPCCSDCNGPNKKAEHQIGFYPYREKKSIKGSPFKFLFKIRNFGKFCSESDVDIGFFEESNMGDLVLYKGNSCLQKYEEIFQIREFYQDYKYKICDVVNDETFQSIEQNNTAGAVSTGRLKPDPERIRKILRVCSLDEKDIHKRMHMKLLLDLGKHLKLLP